MKTIIKTKQNEIILSFSAMSADKMNVKNKLSCVGKPKGEEKGGKQKILLSGWPDNKGEEKGGKQKILLSGWPQCFIAT